MILPLTNYGLAGRLEVLATHLSHEKKRNKYYLVYVVISLAAEDTRIPERNTRE